MKSTNSLFEIILLGVFAAGIATPTEKIFHFSPESGEKLVEGILKCIPKLNFDSSVIDHIKEGKYFEDARVIESFICMSVDRGLGTADGRVNVDAVMKEVFSNNADIRKAFVACEKEYDGTPVGNLNGTLTCVQQNIPFKIRL